jgi:transposase-like protein
MATLKGPWEPLMKRTFTRDFKLSVVGQLVGGQRTLVQVCREHDLHQNVVRRWREQYETLGESAWLEHLDRQPVSVSEGPARIAQLEAALGRAHLEIEFLRQVVEKKGSAPPRRSP